MTDFPELPDFLRRRKGENPPPAEGGSRPKKSLNPLPLPEGGLDKWRQYEIAQREQRVAKSRGRVAKMLAVRSDRAAVEAGKRWDVRTGRWV